MTKKILLGLVGVLILIQFIQINKDVPKVDKTQTFEGFYGQSEMMTLTKEACYDCHSYQTYYPWYSSIAPISWYVKNHIDHGRDELNFDLWGSYSEGRRKRKLDECSEWVSDKKMPLKSYMILHPRAKLDSETRQALVHYFNSLSGLSTK